MTPTDEQVLLDRLKANDRAALREIFDSHYTMVCQSIFQLVRERSTTEDLAQEVFLRFWEKRHQIEVNSSLPAYLRRMGINEGLGHLRKTRRWADNEPEVYRVSAPHENAEGQYLQQELEHHLYKAIQALPPKCRTVFQLSRFEGLTYQEIATQMEISIKTVENQMGKALRVLREKLHPYLHIWLLSLSILGLLSGRMPAERAPNAYPASVQERSTNGYPADLASTIWGKSIFLKKTNPSVGEATPTEHH